MKFSIFLFIYCNYVVLGFDTTNNSERSETIVDQHSYLRIKNSFKEFVREFGKNYSGNNEYETRFNVFMANFLEVENHNSRNHTWKKALNEFSDLTGEEFEKVYGNGYLNMHRPMSEFSKPKENYQHVPKSRDWRKHGMISEIKNQGMCGSCWAHAATEQLESYLRLATRQKLVTISVQQITSCTPNSLQCGGTGGCAGGLPQFGFDYARLVGVVADEEYPYISGKTKNSETCRYNTSSEKAVVYTRGEETLQHNDYHGILHHLAHRGPLAIAVAVTKEWSHYKSGVFDGCSYDENIPLNHAVQLVGYGEDETDGAYWIIRNSWGTGWGEDGYIRLAREKTVKCGLNKTPLSGTGCKNDGIKVQKVCGMCGILFEATYPIGTEATNHVEPTIELVL